MPKFIAVHTAPFTENLFMEWAKQAPVEGFTWKQTYCDFDNNKFFCEWEAPSKEALAEAFQAQNMPFDDIFAVRVFNVGSAAFE